MTLPNRSQTTRDTGILSRRKAMAEINVVPYIDVMLVLLIIFMVTTPLLTQGVKVTLPQASTHPIDKKQTPPIIITIDKQANYYLNIAQNPTQPLSETQLVSHISTMLARRNNANNTRQVLIKGDKKVSYGKVVQVMALLQHAGITRVGLMTDAPHNSH